MLINQDDIYWINKNELEELGNYAHPYVIIQDDLFNHSRIKTVVVCALTTNISRAKDPGNFLLNEGEGNLPKRSAVVVSKVSSVSKLTLDQYIGSLSKSRIDQILTGMRFIQTTYWQSKGARTIGE